MNTAFLQDLLNVVAERGRALLPAGLFGGRSGESLEELVRVLLSGRGEASGVALAQEVLDRYGQLNPDQRRAFFHFLATALAPDADTIKEAARSYLETPGDDTVARLQAAVSSPRLELFQRLNLAPGATAAIVSMRRDLLAEIDTSPELAAVDADLRRLLKSWFNRGFLVLSRIDWQTPAAILEKIIRYEAVHAIDGWDDLRRRLDPADRRCFAFFHPSLVDEPLIFVEVALTKDIPGAIQPVLQRETPLPAGTRPTTAVFYSISNCQPGLKGISFGNFLLKQVVEELVQETPTLGTFVTLSPVPGFAGWLQGLDEAQRQSALDAAAWKAVAAVGSPKDIEDGAKVAAARPAMTSLVARYLLTSTAADGRPADPVARFHLGNGASLARVNWPADTSLKGWEEARGAMVNYRYDLDEIEANHEAFANSGTVAAARAVRQLVRQPAAARPPARQTPVLALPLPGSKSGRAEE